MQNYANNPIDRHCKTSTDMLKKTTSNYNLFIQ